jgi:hypothetical protein
MKNMEMPRYMGIGIGDTETHTGRPRHFWLGGVLDVKKVGRALSRTGNCSRV